MYKYVQKQKQKLNETTSNFNENNFYVACFRIEHEIFVIKRFRY